MKQPLMDVVISTRLLVILVVSFLCAVILLSGCGAIDREVSKLTGKPSSVCVDNVEYLQFTSGATVAYTPDGKIKTCK